MENASRDVFAASNQHKPSLLIVDNDEQNLLYVSLLLQGFNYPTSVAKSAREAFVSATEAHPALIITAIGLPDMSGLNLMKLLWKNPKTAGISFIAMRKQHDAVREEHCYNAGAVGCLCKPVSAELLYRVVQESLHAKPRIAMRIRSIQPVNVESHHFRGESLDMSERGLFLRTSQSVAPNTALSFRINLNGTTISAEAKVVYACLRNEGPYHEPGLGLEFTRISQQDLDFLRRFIKNEIVRGILPEQDMPYPSPSHSS